MNGTEESKRVPSNTQFGEIVTMNQTINLREMGQIIIVSLIL